MTATFNLLDRYDIAWLKTLAGMIVSTYWTADNWELRVQLSDGRRYDRVFYGNNRLHQAHQYFTNLLIKKGFFDEE